MHRYARTPPRATYTVPGSARRMRPPPAGRRQGRCAARAMPRVYWWPSGAPAARSQCTAADGITEPAGNGITEPAGEPLQALVPITSGGPQETIVQPAAADANNANIIQAADANNAIVLQAAEHMLLSIGLKGSNFVASLSASKNLLICTSSDISFIARRATRARAETTWTPSKFPSTPTT